MIIPVHVPSAEARSDDTRDLVTAMRLLSGKDCKRDASQAQVLLVRLSESAERDIAIDADQMLKRSLAADWFGDAVPHYFELERIAEKSLRSAKSRNQLATSLALGVGLLVLLVGGLVAFSFASGGTGEDPPWIMLALVAGMIAAGAAVFLFRHR